MKRQIQISLPATGEEEWNALREPIMSGWLTQGPKVAAFEKAFAERHQVPYALAVSSCTTGLHLILAAMAVGPGDEVIVPAFTWIATANAVVYCGATPVFVDVDRTTFNLSPGELSRKITSRTKAIIAVHLFGLMADIDAIKGAAPGIPIIEDAACAAGASYKGTPAGGLGIAAAFSFHPRKSITTGEGGMITTRSPELAERLNVLRNHGASMSEEQRHNGPKPYILPDFDILGFNYRMTDLQGALGLVQLNKLDRFISERNEAATFYEEALSDVNWIRTPSHPSHITHAWQAYVCYIDRDLAPAPRNKIMELLQERGISTRPGTHAVHMLGYYRAKFGIKRDEYPGSRDCDANSMAIPLHNRMTKDDYAYVTQTLKALG